MKMEPMFYDAENDLLIGGEVAAWVRRPKAKSFEPFVVLPGESGATKISEIDVGGIAFVGFYPADPDPAKIDALTRLGRKLIMARTRKTLTIRLKREPTERELTDRLNDLGFVFWRPGIDDGKKMN